MWAGCIFYNWKVFYEIVILHYTSKQQSWFDDWSGSLINIWYDVKSSVSCIVTCRTSHVSSAQAGFYSPPHHGCRQFPLPPQCTQASVKVSVNAHTFPLPSICTNRKGLFRMWRTHISSHFKCVSKLYKSLISNQSLVSCSSANTHKRQDSLKKKKKKRKKEKERKKKKNNCNGTSHKVSVHFCIPAWDYLSRNVLWNTYGRIIIHSKTLRQFTTWNRF